MSAVRYRIDSGRSKVIVTARSSVHDTKTVWTEIKGFIEVDPQAPQSGASAEIEVDMSSFDAGDWLKNRKLRKDMDVDKHPRATFKLSDLLEVAGDAQKTTAVAKGTIDWRGRSASVEATGHAKLSATGISAHASFDLDVRDVGIKPPRFLMLKVDEIVSVTVELNATA